MGSLQSAWTLAEYRHIQSYQSLLVYVITHITFLKSFIYMFLKFLFCIAFGMKKCKRRAYSVGCLGVSTLSYWWCCGVSDMSKLQGEPLQQRVCGDWPLALLYRSAEREKKTREKRKRGTPGRYKSHKGIASRRKTSERHNRRQPLVLRVETGESGLAGAEVY